MSYKILIGCHYYNKKNATIENFGGSEFPTKELAEQALTQASLDFPDFRDLDNDWISEYHKPKVYYDIQASNIVGAWCFHGKIDLRKDNDTA